MSDFPPRVRCELDGWSLFWAELTLESGSSPDLGRLRAEVAERARASHALASLAEHPTCAAVRRLFRTAGCDPTRYRPSSEALLRRLLKGEELPSIHPFVDLNNCLSVELAVPCCVVAAELLSPPLVLRAGRPGESMLSLRGPFDLAGKPLLADAGGPFGTPITDSERVKVTPATTLAWLVAYLPSGVLETACAAAALRELLAGVPTLRGGRLASGDAVV
jgi:DNA/RNA-binding domain of Phe-tRNA-synthetase-like protein